MYDHLAALYYGETLYTHAPGPLENPSGTLCRQLEQVRLAMGEEFAGALRSTLKLSFSHWRCRAFTDGAQLGGQLMLNLIGAD